MARADALYGALERHAVNEILKLAAGGDKRRILRAFQVAELFTPEVHKGSLRFIRDKIEQDHPVLEMTRRITRLNPTCRDRFLESFAVNSILRGVGKRRELTARTGCIAPTTILVSPTMRCNLACEGCYAGEYSPDRDLDRDLLQRIVDEGNEMGVYLFTFLGGEPFIYQDLLDFAGANRDCYFQVFTNGTLLDGETIGLIAEVGNIAPMVSLEGTPEMTDHRRGQGVHAQVMAAMDGLGKAGVPFGYSVTVARNNWRTLISDVFVDPLLARGALIAWHFMYMPIGRDPDVGLMLLPGERDEFRRGVRRLRDTKPFFPVDFWGDAPWVGGCIAARHYLHITSEGWVEPCIFTHFATTNIRDVSVLEAFNSPYFAEIRRRQPYNPNLLMPCMWIDNPQTAREIMAVTGARPTHDGADVMLTQLHDQLDAYAAEVARVLNPVWNCMSGSKPPGPCGREETASGSASMASTPSARPRTPPRRGRTSRAPGRRREGRRAGCDRAGAGPATLQGNAGTR
jgi:MoaA/NifB/PqqE/SkfB family radical SAM enzyme